MSTYILVHGAWHGGWCWRRVRRLLEHGGHTVYAESLTGAGERRHLLSPNIDMKTYTADITNLIESEELDQVVLVGHSASGAVVSCAAQQVSDAVRSVVFLDGVVVPDGRSIFDLFGEAWKREMETSAQEHGEGWYMPQERTRIDAFFATDCSEDDKQWILRRSTPQPIQPYRDALDLSAYHGLSIPKTYLRCTLSPGGMNHERARSLGMDYVEIAAGHDAMISQPKAVADALHAV